MTFTHILVFSVAGLTLGSLPAKRWRKWLLLAASVLAVYWLQGLTPIRNLDFWLPTATLVLTALTWVVIRDPQAEESDLKQTLIAAGISVGLVLLIGLTRYISPLCCITAARPPVWTQVMFGLVIGGGLVFLLARVLPGTGWKLTALIGGLILLLVVLKTELLAELASKAVRSLTGQAVEQAAGFDIRWLGISYVFFRLVSALRDKQLGTLPDLSLEEFFNYVIFFPTLTAGPIDRADRFSKDYRAPFRLSGEALTEGGQRILVGMFKKFALADTLALVALNATNAAQTDSTLWTWVILYAYAFRIYFDFAGYSDIAIGLGRLVGIKVPENFDKPYRKPNLTTFWNSWHMSLALWFRAYYFNPVSRRLRSNKKLKLPVPVIIAFCQLTTMVLIGMWHGITWNFVIWGAWHGVGLFVHNRWLNAMRARLRKLEEKPRLKMAYDVLAMLVTFHFVVIGWVWFALPEFPQAWDVFSRLFGF